MIPPYGRGRPLTQATRLANRCAGRRALSGPGPVHSAVEERTHEPRHTQRARPRGARAGRTDAASGAHGRAHTDGSPRDHSTCVHRGPKGTQTRRPTLSAGSPTVLAPPRKFKCTHPPAGGRIAPGGGTDLTQASPTGWTWRLLPKPASLGCPSSLPLGTRTQTLTLSRASHITAAPPAPFPRRFPAPLPPAVNLAGLTLPNQTLSVHCRAGTTTTSAAQTRRLRMGGAGGEAGQGGRPSPFLLPPPRGACACRRVGKGAEGQQ